MNMELLIGILAVIITIIFIIILFQIIRFLSHVNNNLKVANKILKEVHTGAQEVNEQLPELVKNSNDLLVTSNDLMTDINRKAKHLDPAFEALEIASQEGLIIVKEVADSSSDTRKKVDKLVGNLFELSDQIEETKNSLRGFSKVINGINTFFGKFFNR